MDFFLIKAFLHVNSNCSHFNLILLNGKPVYNTKTTIYSMAVLLAVFIPKLSQKCNCESGLLISMPLFSFPFTPVHDFRIIHLIYLFLIKKRWLFSTHISFIILYSLPTQSIAIACNWNIQTQRKSIKEKVGCEIEVSYQCYCIFHCYVAIWSVRALLTCLYMLIA